MRPAAPALALLLWPSAALAMNWEGHDDWMTGIAPEYTLETLGPSVAPLPRRACPVTPEPAAQNPYEQVPLPSHKCRPVADPPEPPALTPR